MPDFFNNQCRESAIDSLEFGLCDDEDGTKAYSDCDNPDKWVAKIHNKDSLPLVFTAIDNCLLQERDYEGLKRCDGMLTSERQLYLIELKNKKRSQYQSALEQLESTIKLLHEFHTEELKTFSYKRACACNRKLGKSYHSNESYRNDNKRFRREYGFRIEFGYEVSIRNR